MKFDVQPKLNSTQYMYVIIFIIKLLTITRSSYKPVGTFYVIQIESNGTHCKFILLLYVFPRHGSDGVTSIFRSVSFTTCGWSRFGTIEVFYILVFQVLPSLLHLNPFSTELFLGGLDGI